MIFLMLGICVSCGGQTVDFAGPFVGSVSMAGDSQLMLYGNPSVTAGLKAVQLGFCGMNFYGLEELNSFAAGVVVPTGTAVVGLGLSSFSFATWKRMMLSWSMSRKLGRIAMGFRVNGTRLSVEKQGKVRVSLDVGNHVDISERTVVGLAGSNILGAYFSSDRQDESRYVASFRFALYRDADCLTELQYRAGVRVMELVNSMWFPFRKDWEITLRARWIDPVFSLGISKNTERNLRMGCRLDHHQRLGISSYIFICYAA